MMFCLHWWKNKYVTIVNENSLFIIFLHLFDLVPTNYIESELSLLTVKTIESFKKYEHKASCGTSKDSIN